MAASPCMRSTQEECTSDIPVPFLPAEEANCDRKDRLSIFNHRPSATHSRREKRDSSTIVSQLYCFNFLE